MAKRRVILTFTSETIADPIIHTFGQQFNLITNIRRANMTEDRGWIELDIKGKDKDIEDGITWVTSKGVRVEPSTEI